MARAWGSPEWEADLARTNKRKQAQYHERKADQRCTQCGKRLAEPKARCAACLEATNDGIRERKNDERYDLTASRVDPDARSAFSHQVERACANAYRVERYSRPQARWEVVVYAFPEARAREHAERIWQSYRQSGVDTYTRVRVTDSKGREL